MKKVILFFAVAVIALGVNAQGAKETKPAAAPAKKEVKASDKKADKPMVKKEEKKADAAKK